MTKSQLSLLEDKLKKIRIYRKIGTFLAVILGFVVGSIMMNYLYFLYGGFIMVIVILVSSEIVKRYYNKKEAQVLEQIHKLKLWKGYGEH